jgi:hypothetical protein
MIYAEFGNSGIDVSQIGAWPVGERAVLHEVHVTVTQETSTR